MLPKNYILAAVRAQFCLRKSTRCREQFELPLTLIRQFDSFDCGEATQRKKEVQKEEGKKQ